MEYYNGIVSPNDGCRTNYMDWDQYFMTIAFFSAKRSRDPCKQVGVCIVNTMKKIVALGCNGMPSDCNDDELSRQESTENSIHSKFSNVCHAEVNAISNKKSFDLNNCTMYVGSFPCNDCVKAIIESGIKTIIYINDRESHKPETIDSKRMLDAANVEYRQFIPKMNEIVIDFDNIDEDNQDTTDS